MNPLPTHLVPQLDTEAVLKALNKAGKVVTWSCTPKEAKCVQLAVYRHFETKCRIRAVEGGFSFQRSADPIKRHVKENIDA